MQQTTTPAAGSLLRITGVLMILFGVVGVLIYLLGLAGVFALSYATGGIFSANSDMIGMGLLLAAAITELIAGILGVRAAKRPVRLGGGLLVWGGLCLLLSIVGIGFIALRSTTLPLWQPLAALVLGAVTPIVFLVSAAKLLSVPDTPEEEPAAEDDKPGSRG